MIDKAPSSIESFGICSGLYQIGFYYNGQHVDAAGEYYRFSCEDIDIGYTIFISFIDEGDVTGDGDCIVCDLISMRQTHLSYRVVNIQVNSIGGMIHQLMLWGYQPAIQLARQYKIDSLLD